MILQLCLVFEGWQTGRRRDRQAVRESRRLNSQERRLLVQINKINIQTEQICWGLKKPHWGYFWIIFACTVNHLIQSGMDVYTTKWILKVLPEPSGLWDATMTVLFYWFSLRTFTFGLAPCQCFGLHGVLLGTQKRGWTWLTLCSPLACQEGLQRGQFLAWHSAAWLGTARTAVSINTEF